MSVFAPIRHGARLALAAALGTFGTLGATRAVAQSRANATPPYSLTNSGPSLGQQSGDALITAKAKAALLAASDLDSGDIHVTTESGVVTLSGVVPRRAQKAQAEQTVKQIDNVVGVRNTLDVDEAPQ
ncbi:BON domain-containing protein [Paraburkholderia acidisoli]|uniref:BON domain-containing protein n=1 Tax=Paraburkholderia acidisoli TaxID=2571748 RepID=A0A7Z2GRH2_9BURK|nr:BON domain-containing protein [Paraburkholderia acidisoli]QGZ66552.1 BON domain-containing protein [Paraburkholderia acidisoli]